METHSETPLRSHDSLTFPTLAAPKPRRPPRRSATTASRSPLLLPPGPCPLAPRPLPLQPLRQLRKLTPPPLSTTGTAYPSTQNLAVASEGAFGLASHTSVSGKTRVKCAVKFTGGGRWKGCGDEEREEDEDARRGEGEKEGVAGFVAVGASGTTAPTAKDKRRQ